MGKTLEWKGPRRGRSLIMVEGSSRLWTSSGRRVAPGRIMGVVDFYGEALIVRTRVIILMWIKF